MEGPVVCLIDQRRLPHAYDILKSHSCTETVSAIRQMAVRGAGTIGVTAGFAMAQAALAASGRRFREDLEQAAQAVRSSRPTAKNLFYAVDRVLGVLKRASDAEAARQKAVAEAEAIYAEDVRLTEAIARAGLEILPDGKAVLTHCNAGWLAYPGWGTALAPLYLAHRQGRPLFVYHTETRPRSQGAKLTGWELERDRIPHALIADTAAGHFMRRGEIGAVIVGADRIAANGDTANKIGTYSLAVLAKAHGIPFYVAAPYPTFDAGCPGGEAIPIEERDEGEVTEVEGLLEDGRTAAVRVVPAGTRARNPAFDVTPAELITGFITERGILPAAQEAVLAYLAKNHA